MASEEFVQALMSLVKKHMSVSAVSSTTVNKDTLLDVCRVDDSNHETFEYVCDSILDGKAVRNISNPEHDDYVTGSAKNWVANAGGLEKFKALVHEERHTAEYNDVYIDEKFGDNYVPFTTETVDVPLMASNYFESRRGSSSAFVTNVFLIESGRFEEHQFGICVNGNGRRYVVGDFGKGKVKAFREHTGMYRKIDKATKGNRMKLSDSEVINVYTP